MQSNNFKLPYASPTITFPYASLNLFNFCALYWSYRNIACIETNISAEKQGCHLSNFLGVLEAIKHDQTQNINNMHLENWYNEFELGGSDWSVTERYQLGVSRLIIPTVHRDADEDDSALVQ